MKKEKKGLLALVLALTLALPAVSVQAASYSDVTEAHWAYSSIEKLYKNGMISDMTLKDGSFSPDSAITRGEFVTLIVKLCADGKTAELKMKDSKSVKASQRGYLGAANELGVFAGSLRDDGVYAMADTPLTREDASAILGRLVNAETEGTTGFKDSASIASYAEPYITALGNAGIISGYSDGYFYPKTNLTRAQGLSLADRAGRYAALNKNTVTTFAGAEGKGYADGKSDEALFYEPQGIAAGEIGSLLIFDTGNNLIRKISGKTVSTVAGTISARHITGEAAGGYADIRAERAAFYSPVGGVRASNGDVLVADSANNVVRIIRDGIVYTFCGTGKAGYAEGAANEALFNSPGGVAIDSSDNIYVADTLNQCIRKIDKDGNSSLLAGTPGKEGYSDGNAASALFCEPTGIVVTSTGAVYVSDSGNQRIRKIENGKVTTIAGSGNAKDPDTNYIYGGYTDGLAADSSFSFPQGLALAGDSVIFVADTKNNAVRAIIDETSVVTVSGGRDAGYADGNSLEALFNAPTGVLYLNGRLYIVDSLNSAVRAVNIDVSLLK